MSIGESIRLLRIRMDFTLKELAMKANISPSTLSKYEKETSAPSSIVLKRIADALKTTSDEIINFDIELYNNIFRNYNFKSRDYEEICNILDSNNTYDSQKVQRLLKIREANEKLFDLDIEQLNRVNKFINKIIKENKKQTNL
ncbi:TPA: helix-turn-helix domain-containing protein [Clostridioides difficile]|nr:helix-turn-helix domain-containing protein [Clostridioides difficile]HBF9108105.1 helix-turn-helix domain-containing protein [Clostridioides difficile]